MEEQAKIAREQWYARRKMKPPLSWESLSETGRKCWVDDVTSIVELVRRSAVSQGLDKPLKLLVGKNSTTEAQSFELSGQRWVQQKDTAMSLGYQEMLRVLLDLMARGETVATAMVDLYLHGWRPDSFPAVVDIQPEVEP